MTDYQICIHQFQYNHQKLNLPRTNPIRTINEVPVEAKQKRFILLPTEISLGGQSHCNTSPVQSLNACQLSSMLISIVSLLSAIQLSIRSVLRSDPSGLSWEKQRDGWIFYGRLQETLRCISQRKTG